MKKCPYCAEEILDEAIKCKHCGEIFDNKEVKDIKTQSPRRNLGCLLMIIFLLLLFYTIGESCIRTIISTGEVSYNPEVRTETKKLKENINLLGEAFKTGFKGDEK